MRQIRETAWARVIGRTPGIIAGRDVHATALHAMSPTRMRISERVSKWKVEFVRVCCECGESIHSNPAFCSPVETQQNKTWGALAHHPALKRQHLQISAAGVRR